MADTAIETGGLTRRFGRTLAVDGLDLKVPAGTLFGLIGPNGAGKTTTLRMLAGLETPTAGWIRYGEGEAQGAAAHRVGYMPDFFGVYEDMRTWEYLDFFARCYGMTAPRRKEAVEQLLELVDLTAKRDADVHTLSRGMKQRLCLAHALVHDPEILLLDEPASGLDPRARLELRELLRELHAMRKTVIISSHILSELAEVCDAIGIMERGRLVAHGTLAEIEHRLGGRQALRLRVTDDVSGTVRALEARPGVSDVAEELADAEDRDGPGRWIRFLFDGDENARAELLRDLVRSGVPVSALTVRERDLEGLFLQLTKGDVS